MRDEKKITSVDLITEQRKAYRETLTGGVLVPAGAEASFEIKISTLGAFACSKVTGSYETLTLDGVDIVDDGVCRISTQITDGANSLPLTNDFVPLDLILSPGRVRSAKATNNLTTAPAGSFLFFPFEFSYVFAMASSVQFRVRNSGTVPVQFNIALHGKRLRG